MNYNDYTIPLFGKIVIANSRDSRFVQSHFVDLFNTELATCGYSLSANAIQHLKKTSPSSFDQTRKLALETVQNLSSIPNIRVLFNKFPYDIPNDTEYLTKRVIGYLQNQLNFEHGRLLSCGHVIDQRIFNLDDFGSCPICQFEVDELNTNDRSNFKFKNISPLKELDVLFTDEFKDFAERLLARNSSLSKQEKEFLFHCAHLFSGMKFPEKCFKETLPFVYADMEEYDYVRSQLSGATDVLRLAYYVSDHDSDLSLKENVKFKISTKHKKNFLSYLNDMLNLEEDFMRNRERWLRFGEYVHPESKRYNKFENVQHAFNKLRNDSKNIQTFNRLVEQNVNDIPTLIGLLSSRPGEFARRLDKMIRNCNDNEYSNIKETFAGIANKIPTRMLLELQSHFRYRSLKNKEDQRLFFIKGANKYFIKSDDRPSLEGKASDMSKFLYNILVRQFRKNFMGYNELGKVFIDPALKGRLIPFNRRGDSTKSESFIEKGSRIPFSGDVIRLFVWWKGNVDVDLSASFYKEDWETAGHVAYTNLSWGNADAYAYHSGDIQNAPNGAAEFIDIDLKAMRRSLSPLHRYVITSIISYRGDAFDNFPCYGGFMERDALKSGKIFEPMAVKTKVEIKGKHTAHAMFAFDLHTNEIIFIDMQSGKGRFGGALAHNQKFKEIANGIVNLTIRKPTFFDILLPYATANGKIVDVKEDADIVFDYDMEVEKIYELLEK